MTTSKGNVTALDRAVMTPSVKKENVSLTIRENGDVRLVTENMTPRHPLVIRHNTLPNDRPEIAKTVLDNNQMELYDVQGNLIRIVPNQSASVPYAAEQLKPALEIINHLDISQIMASLRSNVDFTAVMDMINNPPASVQVGRVNQDIRTIRMPIPTEANLPDAKSVVNIIDITNKLLLGTRLYNGNSKVMQCMVYKYDDRIMTGFKQEVKMTLPSGTDAMMVTYAELENININYLQ